MSQPQGGTSKINPAEAYQRFFVPTIFVPWTPELLKRATPQTGERVLDVACGTGIIARHVAPLIGEEGQVTALDFSPAMLAVARSLPAPKGATISWHEGSALALPFPAAAFDLVLCQQGLQFFPDRPAALQEMRRVLAPGGRVVLSVWQSLQHNPGHEALLEVAARHLGNPALMAPFSLGGAIELRTLLNDAGFSNVVIEPVALIIRFPSREDFVRQSVLAAAAVLPELAQLDEAGLAALVSAVRQDSDTRLQGYTEGKGLAFPMAAHIARAQA